MIGHEGAERSHPVEPFACGLSGGRMGMNEIRMGAGTPGPRYQARGPRSLPAGRQKPRRKGCGGHEIRRQFVGFESRFERLVGRMRLLLEGNAGQQDGAPTVGGGAVHMPPLPGHGQCREGTLPLAHTAIELEEGIDRPGNTRVLAYGAGGIFPCGGKLARLQGLLEETAQAEETGVVGRGQLGIDALGIVSIASGPRRSGLRARRSAGRQAKPSAA